MNTAMRTALFLCLAFAGNVFACQCRTPDLRMAIKDADVIFSGIVVRGEVLLNKDPSPSQDASPYVGRRFRFSVIRAYKGKIGKEVEIETGMGRGDCGYSFEIGRDYLVYASGTAARLGTSICSRTGQAIEQDYSELEKLRKKP